MFSGGSLPRLGAPFSRGFFTTLLSEEAPLRRLLSIFPSLPGEAPASPCRVLWKQERGRSSFSTLLICQLFVPIAECRIAPPKRRGLLSRGSFIHMTSYGFKGRRYVQHGMDFNDRSLTLSHHYVEIEESGYWQDAVSSCLHQRPCTGSGGVSEGGRRKNRAPPLRSEECGLLSDRDGRNPTHARTHAPPFPLRLPRLAPTPPPLPVPLLSCRQTAGEKSPSPPPPLPPQPPRPRARSGVRTRPSPSSFQAYRQRSYPSLVCV